MDTFIHQQGSQHKIEKTDRQTDKLCTEITEEKTVIKTATKTRHSNTGKLTENIFTQRTSIIT